MALRKVRGVKRAMRTLLEVDPGAVALLWECPKCGTIILPQARPRLEVCPGCGEALSDDVFRAVQQFLAAVEAFSRIDGRVRLVVDIIEVGFKGGS